MTTHHHSIAAIPDSLAVDAYVPIALHAVTCVFEDDPTSDDAIITSNIWLEPDQVAGEPFKCPVCGDEISMEADREQ